MKTLVKFLKDEQGLETVEWTIMAALVVLGIVLAVTTLQGKVANVFNALGDEMDSSTGT